MIDRNSLLFLAALGFSLGGFAALSLAMDRHYEDWAGRGQEPGRWRGPLRLLGTAGVALSLAASVARQGWSVGWVLWAGVLTAGALALVLVLTYAPRRANWLLGGATGVALLAGIGALAAG
ncbi:DUF3325 domain-containing protein [Xylophilus sp.]|uniref:DUF3325 domain-containing protein n=1 Tax=Xylophilus sp. TaxID=2653893 RepID=UPI0013B9D80D|nr:DUF3325 domain-containing protein [Xylophilus sp.]KAF1048254.1 MAG: hypothetical protein GAK38_01503 [Xylophilus sp.]